MKKIIFLSLLSVLYHTLLAQTEPEEVPDSICCFKLLEGKLGMEPGRYCCNIDCCNKLKVQLNGSLHNLKNLYGQLRAANSNYANCCESLYHSLQFMLIDSLPLRSSKQFLLSVLGKPDRVSRHFTYLEKKKYNHEIPLRDRTFGKKIYRYDVGIRGRVYWFFVIRFGKVVYKKFYLEVC